MMLQNERLRVVLEPETLAVRELVHCGGAAQRFTPEEGRLLRLYGGGEELPPQRFTVTAREEFHDGVEGLAAVAAECSDLRVRIALVTDKVGGLRVIVQGATCAEAPPPLALFCPFLAALNPPGPDGRRYYPAAPATKPDGGPVMQPHPLFPLPYVLTDGEDGLGYAVRFPALSTLEPAVQNRNVELQAISCAAELHGHRLPVRLGPVLADLLELEITALSGGWREAFARERARFRKSLDRTEYRRDDLDWMNDSLLHHFTYLYGDEAWDCDAAAVDIDGLAHAGREFGGFDSLTLWHQYPRLGVDTRSQWEFFDDYPGGRQGLRDAVERAHRQGMRVFLPYKPWDIGPGESMDCVCGQVAGLVRDTDADGLFLDTMDSLPGGFRQAVDAVRPGVVFCSEAHPATATSLTLLTSSWDQFWSRAPMPEVDCLRFALPEHSAPMIQRWALGENKDALIKRAIFSGTGLVIWQDIFGAWLPYTREQRECIRRYKAMWSENRAIFRGGEPLPLYPTLAGGLLCNRFSDGEGRMIYTLCNTGAAAVAGELVRHRDWPAARGAVVWGDGPLTLRGDIIAGTVAPGAVAAIRIEKG